MLSDLKLCKVLLILSILSYTNEHVDLYPVIYTTLAVFRKKKSSDGKLKYFTWMKTWRILCLAVCAYICLKYVMFEIHHNVSILHWSTLGWRNSWRKISIVLINSYQRVPACFRCFTYTPGTLSNTQCHLQIGTCHLPLQGLDQVLL